MSIDGVSISMEGDSDDDNLGLDLDDQTTQHGIKKIRKSTSIVWKYFIKQMGEDGKMRVECKFCSRVYVGESTHGTSNLRRHLKLNCPSCPIGIGDRDKMLNSFARGDTLTRTLGFDQDHYREALAMSIVRHEYPFQYVEHEGTRYVHSVLNSDVKHITRNTAKADILKLYNSEKMKLHQFLQALPSRICLTSDMWSSLTTDGYMCITAHFIDKEWKLHKRILNFIYMPSPHTGSAIAIKFSELMSAWGVEEKLFSITLDNASANLTFCDAYESRLNLKNALLLRGRFFRLRCCAHILNLIVQEGLKEVDEAVHMIRESVKYIKGSQARKEQFVECLNELGMQGPKRLRQDVPTRWNSTYLMLERALSFRLVFFRYALSDSNYTHCSSNEEWCRVEKIAKFLKLFYDLTNSFSGTTYPTSNLYFQGVWKIELHLKEALEGRDDFLKSMAQKMKVKFDKYWSDFSIVLAIATILDPRYKMKMIDFCYRKLYRYDDQYRTTIIRGALDSLFSEYFIYSSRSANAPISGSTTHEIASDIECQEEMQGYDSFQSYANIQEKKSQLDLYLEEPCYDWKQPLDILNYWKSVEYRFPELARMARDVLTIPISTVASEAAFSTGGRVLDQYRSSLLPSNVEALICTKDWLFGSKVEMKNDLEACLEIDLIDASTESSFIVAPSSSSSSNKRIKASARLDEGGEAKDQMNL